MTENTIPYATQVRTAGEVARLLARRRPKPALAAEREAMTVWRPFEDELLAYWLRGADAALSEGAALLKRYEALTAAHPLTGRHRDPRSPAAVLRRALLERVSGRELSSRSAGLVSRATASMVARHGAPGSAAHTRLRQDQARRAARPAHHELAALVSRRLARLDQDSGLSDVDAPVAPVTAEEARETGLPVGTPVPASVRALVATALRAPAAVLVQRGVATSAEDLAGLAGSLLAAELAPGHGPYTPDERSAAPEVRDSARAALRRLAAFGLESFPAADPTPRFLAELAALAGRAGLCASFALEPYADTYTRTVTASVLPAARVSAELLHGTPYARYFGIDFVALRELARADDREGFERLCADRAALPRPGLRPERPPPSPALAKNPALVEQVRILTSGNLAPLIGEFGVVPSTGWDALARDAFTEARRRGATAKRTARAWRHLLFHLSQCDAERRAAVLDWIDSETARLPAARAAGLAPLIADTRGACELPGA
ncbi:hypothetical protein [Streptomyces sp. G1]|uniref:hypothetical protein n=1 Tax=Streptomyces sp. G1 TaxID=361572 RepID=UPI00202E6EE6|nr:hypothetical protein [Streptomyces sp. G1]MCM1968235.1 hypothetical protein [Streptomyces sp. G1]